METSLRHRYTYRRTVFTAATTAMRLTLKTGIRTFLQPAEIY